MILGSLDAEIAKLKRVREILADLDAPIPQKIPKAKRRSSPLRTMIDSAPMAATAPPLTVLPAKVKREYSPRRQGTPELPRALVSAPFDKPVFVPKVAVSTSPTVSDPAVLLDPEKMEAAFRKSFLQSAS